MLFENNVQTTSYDNLGTLIVFIVRQQTELT